MQIDWTHFTPWTSFAGGVTLDSSPRCSSCLSAALWGSAGSLTARSVPVIANSVGGQPSCSDFIAAPTALKLLFIPRSPNIDMSWTRLAIAGLLVGFGTRLGSGCTSGHGICGLSRLSPRSLVATLTFMSAGFVTVYVVRHLAS